MKTYRILWLTLAVAGALSGKATDRKVTEAIQARAGTPEMEKYSKAISEKALSDESRKALDFLYAYMPLPDVAAHSPEFFMENVASTLKAREEMPWGKDVPEREWLHFVLPLRVNNEVLDMSRPLFYEELKERVRHLSMSDAILEVNHWCHEKVTYRPSDGRTSSPLSTLSQAIGRCGEESTFAVAALRSVGIPARQVYTPRWAHTDDNHAWVEAWADGEWHFIGACEPQPILDLAWFNAPASRGMMMSTNVFGDYDGPEEVLMRHPLITRINVTSNYAPVVTHEVRVVDAYGNPLENVAVDFCIYNYAEYYPVAEKKTDSEGRATLLAGCGDLVVWATDGSSYGMAKSEGTPDNIVTIVVDRNPETEWCRNIDIVPPTAGAVIPKASEKESADNERRLATEDSIRHAYMATFADTEGSRAAAAQLGVDGDKLEKILLDSRGNHENILNGLRSSAPEKRARAMALLAAVTEKDRRDIPMEVVADNVGHTPFRNDIVGEKAEREDWFNCYVLSPRVENEGLVPYKEILGRMYGECINMPAQEAAAHLAQRISKDINEDESDNPQGLRQDPLSTLLAGRGNALSRAILYVAAARSVGIPARIDPVTGKTQYSIVVGKWNDVDFGKASENLKGENSVSSGRLMLGFEPEGFVRDPKYYSSFTLSKIENGRPHLLEYPEEATWSNTFADGVELDSGSYLLTTGQRMADGGVLARSMVINVGSGETIDVPLMIRHDDSAISVIGSLNAENPYYDIAEGSEKSVLSTTGRGYYVLGIVRSNHEPSAHILNELSALAEQYEETGRETIVLFENDSDAAMFRRELFGRLPSNLHFGVDSQSVIKEEIETSLHLDDKESPLFVVADSFNRIVFVSTGYAIGMGERILSILSRVD